MIPRLVVSLAAASDEQLLAELAPWSGRVAVEIRLDSLPSAPPWKRVRESFQGLLIATVRRLEEGGRRALALAERREWLLAALAAGWDFIDVEGRSELADDPRLVAARSRTVLSFHAAAGEAIAPAADELARRGPALVKVVAWADSIADNRPVFELLRRWREPVSLAAFAQGPGGVVSRLLAPGLGSAISYLAPDAERATAPGQIAFADASEPYGLDRPRPIRRLFGVVASAPERSRSPHLHNPLLRREFGDALYVPMRVTDWEREQGDLLDGDDFIGSGAQLLGLSVTRPWKEAALVRADRQSERARVVGAANTLSRTADGWLADNTDVLGFTDLLGGIPRRESERALVLGSGGTARAALVALGSRGSRVAVAARSERGRELAANFGADFVSWGNPWPAADLYLNTTPIDAESPIAAERLGPGVAVIDAVYGDRPTALIQLATARGAIALDGHRLLAAQALHQARLFLGRPDLASID